MVQAIVTQSAPSVAEALDAIIAADGTGAHAYVRSGKLADGRDAMRNLADAVHFLCVLHGRHPGVIDHAAAAQIDPDARAWLNEAADGFATERALLAAMASKVGPIPSTHGQAACEAAAASQRHALDMLARSERRGCALGAAIALTLDWRTLRVLIDISAQRLDMAVPTLALPGLPATARLANAHAASPAVERAMLFGAQQLASQHRALWDLLATREVARTGS